jgi:trehalose 6-phosphate phosphatase
MADTAVARPLGVRFRSERFQSFFAKLRACGRGTLMLDYDGTLAPFTPDRETARPYPEIPRLLDQIMKAGRTRVIIVSGRPAGSVALLLGTRRIPEIWGLHGLERINAAGIRELLPFSESDLQVLAEADMLLSSAGLREYLEFKAGSVAVHWRGLPAAKKKTIRLETKKIMDSLAAESGLEVLDFAEGLELRVSSTNKGDAVRKVLGERAASPAVYIGDDITDEDAFRAINELDGLSILMLPTDRDTDAQERFRTPLELFAFLGQWMECCGGVQ